MFSFASEILLTLTKGNQHVHTNTYMHKHELICFNYFLRAKGIYNTKSNLSISPTICMYICYLYVLVHMKTYIIYEGTKLLMVYVIYTYVQIIQSARGSYCTKSFRKRGTVAFFLRFVPRSPPLSSFFSSVAGWGRRKKKKKQKKGDRTFFYLTARPAKKRKQERNKRRGWFASLGFGGN